jgi:hypothetical protein
MKMSGLPAMTLSPPHAGAAVEMKKTTRSRAKRQGSFVLAVAVALVVTACGDIRIEPVNHSCPDSCGGGR